MSKLTDSPTIKNQKIFVVLLFGPIVVLLFFIDVIIVEENRYSVSETVPKA